MKKRFLAAKNGIATAILALGIVNSSNAGIPVIDTTNIVQTTVSAAQNTAMVLKQIEEYRSQLQQLEIQIRDNLAPAAYLWDQAQSTISSLMGAVNTLDYYRNQLGGIDKYLSKFQDVNYYKNSPCFKPGGVCTPAERTLLEENRTLASESQKKANVALFETLYDQQQNIKNDSRRLEDLQRNAQGAKGQMEAIGFATQIASHQSNQLLQIRALLIAQQNAVGAQMQAQADREAQIQANDKKYINGNNTKLTTSPKISF
jgi:P-type conjugative transfer protein TrbJ